VTVYYQETFVEPTMIIISVCIYVAGICGNQAFPEMPRQLEKKISMVFILTIFQIWEKAEH